MTRFLAITIACVLLCGSLFTVAFAAGLPPDDYLGDSAIYVGVPNQRPKPNVLFVIDTSRATLGRAAGIRFDPASTYTSTFNYDRDTIYYGDQQGGFSPTKPLGGNSPVALAGVTCTTTYQTRDPVTGETVTATLNVFGVLSDFGTYSGGGSLNAPNLDRDGACATAPQGAVYATGNYLNYINSQTTVSTDSIIIEHTYPALVKVGKNWVTQNVTRKFELIANIVNTDGNPMPAPASAEPGVGSDRAIYWSQLDKNDNRTPNFPYTLDGDGNRVWTGADGWILGSTEYYIASLDPSAAGFKSQREAFYEALEPVIRGASPSVNFGFLTYNPNNQGAVIGAHIADYSANPGVLTAALPQGDSDGDGSLEDETPAVINSGPNRPQSEALYDAGYYFGAVYRKTDGSAPNKQSINLTDTDPNPNPCGYNHVIFLTNGLPNQDTNTPDLGDWDGDQYPDEGSYGLGTHYLDDVAYFLQHKTDINNDGKFGDVTTHVVLAFQAEDALMRQTADNGGGAFYNVYDTQGLTKALQEILTNIVSETNTAFVAPVVPASSTNRTLSSNRVYLGLFKPQSNAPWRGNLKKYKVGSDNTLLDVYGHRATDTAGDFIYSQSYWGTNADGKILSAEEPFLRNAVAANYDPDTGTPDPGGGDGGIVDAGGVGGTLLARDFSANPRKIYTYLTAANSSVAAANPNLTVDQNAFRPANAHVTGVTTLGLPDEIDRDRLINFIHGYDAYTTGRESFKRSWVLGDILHSKPLIFNYAKYPDSAEDTCYDPSSSPAPGTYNASVIFVGANDGMLHAFSDCDGTELWAFIPPVLLDDLRLLPLPGHEYFVDGAPTLYVHDYDGDGTIEPDLGDKVVILFGLRRGGGNAYLTAGDPRGAYYALDITNPLVPQYMWEVKGGGTALGNPYYEMGEAWTQPRLSKVKDGTVEKVVMMVGAGYDNNEDRRWGNTQGFPVSTVSAPVDPDTDTDTSVATDDGDPGVSNAGVTSLANGSQLNPKGRGLFLVEVASLAKDVNGKYVPSFTNSGSLVWSYTYGSSASATTNPNMTFSIPSDLTVLDWDEDGFADRIYVADTGGQMWRFSLPLTLTDGIRQGVKSNWTADVIFRSNPGADSPATNGRKLFYRPAVARTGGYAMLYFGSGDREHPLNLASADRLYMLFDRGQGLLNALNPTKTESDLVDVTANTLQDSSDSAAVSSELEALYADTNYGWYIKLENPGEKMLAGSVVFYGQVFFTTYAPLTSGQDNCEVGNLGTSRLYHLDFRTGEAVYNYWAGNDDTDNGNERSKSEDGTVLMKSDRIRILGEGIPSGIVTLMDASGKVTMMISASNRVGTYAAPDVKLITPVYWMQWNN